MTVRCGEICWADLDPIRGSEQVGVRPVLIFQNDAVSRFTTTVLAIPLTTNLRRALLPSCVRIPQGEGGLTSESVALCYQKCAFWTPCVCEPGWDRSAGIHWPRSKIASSSQQGWERSYPHPFS